LTLRGLWNFYLVQAEFITAREFGEQLVSLAHHVPDLSLLPESHQALGTTFCFLGEFPAAREHLEQAISHYDLQKHRSLAFPYGFDPGVLSLSWTAVVLWFLGYPGQALKRSREALSLAQELSHPYSLAAALIYAAWLHQFRREEQLTTERAEAAITLSTEQGFALWGAMGPILRGWALAEQRQGEEGIAQMRQGLTAFRATGAEVAQSYHLVLLAESCGKVGQAEEGLTVLAEALAAVDKTEERFHEAELYRLKGKLVLQSRVQGPESKNTNTQHPAPSPQQEAEACFLKAIEIARRQQAKSLESDTPGSAGGLMSRAASKAVTRVYYP
jgi:predicted ATPase